MNRTFATLAVDAVKLAFAAAPAQTTDTVAAFAAEQPRRRETDRS